MGYRYKNILLINPSLKEIPGTNNFVSRYPALGLAYLASVLRNNNIRVKIVDANVLELDSAQVMKIISSEAPDLVGISLNIATARNGMELSCSIKNSTDIKVCLGGPFASSNIEQVLLTANADFIVFGEGENTLLDLCKGKPVSAIKGLAWKSAGGRVVINEPADLIQSLDDIPIPAYDLLPSFKLCRSIARRSPVASMLTSRGCQYSCTYCTNHIFGNQLRMFSPKRVIEEMELLVSKHGIKQIDILDDNFTQDINHAEEILDLIIERKLNISINFQSGLRADTLTYPIVKKMKKAGVFRVSIGCESGNKQIIKEIKKNLDLSRVKQAIKWLKEEGIMTNCFFMLGFPSETPQAIWDTINFAIEANPLTAAFSVLIPFPGTEIHAFLKERGLLDEDLMNGVIRGYFNAKMYHKCPNLTQEQIYKLHSLAYRRFYLRFNKIIEILKEIRSLNELLWYFNILKGASPVIKDSFQPHSYSKTL
jgi:anaerobic magnesium-protoporphyrin IX monomethyl ester cyclase